MIGRLLRWARRRHPQPQPPPTPVDPLAWVRCSRPTNGGICGGPTVPDSRPHLIDYGHETFGDYLRGRRRVEHVTHPGSRVCTRCGHRMVVG